MTKTIVAWVSRHLPVPAQKKELEEKLGRIEIVPMGDTYTNYNNIIQRAKNANAKYGVLVIPLSMTSLILENDTSGIIWMFAEMRAAHKFKCNGKGCMETNPDTDVFMDITDHNTRQVTGHRHLRFKEFTVLKSIEVIKAPLLRQEVIHCGIPN